MNRYQISSPRKVFAIAAVAMTAITIALSVVAPAKMQSDARDLQALTTQALTRSKAMTPGPAEVAASRLQVYVVGIREPAVRVPGVREPELVSAHVRNPPPKRKQDS